MVDIETLEEQGQLLYSYPVDEMGNPNCGHAEVYLLNGKKYEIINWNEDALENECGHQEIVELKDE